MDRDVYKGHVAFARTERRVKAKGGDTGRGVEGSRRPQKNKLLGPFAVFLAGPAFMEVRTLRDGARAGQ